MRNAKKLEIAPVRKQTEEDRGSGGREGQVRAKGKRKARAREGAHGRGGWTEQEGREGSKGDVAERMGKGDEEEAEANGVGRGKRARAGGRGGGAGRQGRRRKGGGGMKGDGMVAPPLSATALARFQPSLFAFILNINFTFFTAERPA